MKKRSIDLTVRLLSIAAITVLITSCAHTSADVAKVKTNPKKLKVVIMAGQSNMVGYAAPRTAWYLTQPAYELVVRGQGLTTNNR